MWLLVPLSALAILLSPPEISGRAIGPVASAFQGDLGKTLRLLERRRLATKRIRMSKSEVVRYALKTAPHKRLRRRVYSPAFQKAATFLSAHATRREIRELIPQWWRESKMNNRVVSRSGKHFGFGQVDARIWKTSGERLMEDPAHSAAKSLEAYRAFRRKYGRNWRCRYEGWANCEDRW